MSDASSILSSALEALSRGWSVIPLSPGSKQPCRPWSPYTRRRPTEEEVRRWWETTPSANLGIITGGVSGICVVDVDPRNGGDLSLARTAPTGYVVHTPGGGLHLYYKNPGGIRKSKPLPGVDLQAEGSYVVAPPSFVQTSSYSGHYTRESDGPLADLPAYLTDGPSSQTSSVPGEAWVSALLERGCPPGTRNDNLTRLAGYFCGKGVPRDICTSILFAWLGRQVGTGVTPAEAEATINGIYSRHFDTGTADSSYVVDAHNKEVSSERPIEFLSLRDFVPAHHADEAEWLIPGWLPDKTVAFVVSPPGSFKTMLTFDLAVSVASGARFLGSIPVRSTGPVVILQQEDSYGGMARRFNRIFASRSKRHGRLSQHGPTFSVDMGAGFPEIYVALERSWDCSIQNLRRLEDLIRKTGPKLVIIDPLYSVTSTDDYMARAASDLMPIKSLRDEYGVGFVVSAHTRKGSTETHREDVWGSQFINAFLETGWQIRPMPEPAQIQIQRHFKDFAIPPRVRMEFLIDQEDHEGPGYTVVFEEFSPDSPPAVFDGMLRCLTGLEGPFTVEAAAAAANVSISTAYRKLGSLRDRGLVEHTPPSWRVVRSALEELSDGHPRSSETGGGRMARCDEPVRATRPRRGRPKMSSRKED